MRGRGSIGGAGKLVDPMTSFTLPTRVGWRASHSGIPKRQLDTSDGWEKESRIGQWSGWYTSEMLSWVVRRQSEFREPQGFRFRTRAVTSDLEVFQRAGPARMQGKASQRRMSM